MPRRITFLYDGTVVPDPKDSSPGPRHKTARTVAIDEGETLNATTLQTMFDQIIANHRAGG